ncbi:putative Amastin surface glycoprotein [Leishmania naiffi]|uniref:Amastin surface glycoprotein n=1 Tax=Leishmania naiffi TaxID=5678 RepID=A0AAW3CBU9_9TRYP
MAWTLGLLIYAVVQFVAFFCVLVATPIDMFFFRSTISTSFPKRCITLWGSKLSCSSTMYSVYSDILWALCPARRDRFRAAQAFALISIFVYGAAFVLGAIMLFCYRWLRWVCLTLNVVGAVTVFIVWVAMAVTYNKNDGDDCILVKTFFTYGAGFVLLLLAWLLDIANIPVLLLLCREGDSGESGKATEKKSQECEEETKEKERQD